MFTRAGCSPRSQLRYGLGVGFSSRSCSPLSIPLQPACGPGDSGHTDLPLPVFVISLKRTLTARTGDGHAPPLSLSGKVFNLAFTLLSLPVRFPALTPIKPQASRLVVLPRQFL